MMFSRKRKHVRRCPYCWQEIEVKRPKTYKRIQRTYWGRITKEYLYHNDCWTKKRDNENMRKYRERLNDLQH